MTGGGGLLDAHGEVYVLEVSFVVEFEGLEGDNGGFEGHGELLFALVLTDVDAFEEVGDRGELKFSWFEEQGYWDL